MQKVAYATVAGIVGLFVIIDMFYVLKFTFDSNTWKIDTKDKNVVENRLRKFKRGFIANHIGSIIVISGNLLLAPLGISATTILTTFDMLWTSILLFLVEYVITSNEGLHTFQTKGRRIAFRDAFRSLSTRKFCKYLLIVTLMACLSSLIMTRVNPILNTVLKSKPSFVPSGLIYIMVGSIVGNLLFYSFVNYMRVNWAFAEGDVGLFDGVVALLSVIVAIVFLLQKANNQNILETQKGRFAICVFMMVLCSIILTSSDTQRGSLVIGVAIYFCITLVSAIVLSTSSKKYGNKLLPFCLATMFSPMLTIA